MINEAQLDVEQIFHRVLPMSPEERACYFEHIPDEEAWLVDEVTSLIACYEASPDLLEENALELGFAVLGDIQTDIPSGHVIGSYRIERLLGRGGMGDVYLANDLTLNRYVALKFLASDFADDSWAKRQFIREARAVAMLDHKNICTVYGYEEVEGRSFISMQFVDGVSLATLIRKGSIEHAKIPQMALQMAEAIAAAHEHGILHRDIKPGNIMIASDGEIKVLDFGIAKQIRKADSVDPELTAATRPGLLMGTMAYMSPEQLRKETLDFQSDIFSLGTVFFEMMTGRHPFEKRSEAETISAILEKEIPFSKLAAAGIPVRLRQVVKKCTEKRKELRYQSANDIVLALQQPYRRGENIHVHLGKIFAIAFLALFAAVIGYYYFQASAPKSLLLMPFTNETGDDRYDYLALGMAENLSLQISTYGKLKVKSLPEVSVGSDPDPIKVGQNNSVELVLTGRMTNQSDGLVLETSLLSASSGIKIKAWNIRFEEGDIPTLQERVANDLISGLSLPPADPEVASIRQAAFSKNGEAVRQYFIGRFLWNRRDETNIKKAIEAFERSIELDPGYSRSYSGLADSYVLLNLVAYNAIPTKDAMTKARAAARQALQRDPNDVQARTSLAIVLMKYEWNWKAAEREFQLAIAIDPDYAPAHYSYSGLLAILGRTAESIEEAKKAKDLDPLTAMSDVNLARAYYYGRQYDEAVNLLNSAPPAISRDNKIRYMTGLTLLQKRMYVEAKGIFEDISVENRLFGAAALGFAYAKLGRRDDALRLIEELKKRSATEFVPHQEFAIIYVGLNDNNEAMKYLDLAFEERHAALISVKVEPLFDGLRDDPRFVKLTEAMQL